MALFGLFTMEWTGAALSEGRPYWDPPIFHPHRGTFAWSEPQPFTAFLVASLSRLLGLPAAYNAVLLLFLTAAGSAGYALARRLTVDRAAALWAGLWLTAGAYPIQQIGVLHLLAAGFPIACVALVLAHAAAARPAAAWGAGAAYALTFLTCAQYGLFLTILLPFAAAPALIGKGRGWRPAALLAGALAAGLALAAPLLAAQRARLAEAGLERSLVNVRGSYRPVDLIVPADGHWLTTGLLGVSSASGAYPHDLGVVPIACLAGAWIAGTFRIRPLDPPRRRAAAGLLAMSAAAILLGFGPALGVEIGGTSAGPYAWLHAAVPGLSGVRTPSRFALFAGAGAAALGAAALAALRERAGSAAPRRALTAAAYALLLAEMWAAPIGLADPRDGIDDHRGVVAWMKEHAGGGAVLEVPASRGDSEAELASDVRAMRRAIRHGRPIVNGYSGYLAETYRQLRWAMERDPQGRGLRYLQALGVRHVLVHDHDLGGAAGRALAAFPGAEVVHAGGRDTVIRLAGDGPPAPTPPPASAPPFPAEPRAGDVLRIPVEPLADRARLISCGADQLLQAVWTEGGEPAGGKVIRLRGSVLLDAGEAWLHLEVLRLPRGRGPAEAVLLSSERLARSRGAAAP